MTKVKEFSSDQALRLAELTAEIVGSMAEVGNELNCEHNGNMITIIVGTEYGTKPLTEFVQLDDTAESVHERFVAQLELEYQIQEAFERYDRDNYEHASVTQGRAFDSLTC